MQLYRPSLYTTVKTSKIINLFIGYLLLFSGHWPHSAFLTKETERLLQRTLSLFSLDYRDLKGQSNEIFALVFYHTTLHCLIWQ